MRNIRSILVTGAAVAAAAVGGGAVANAASSSSTTSSASPTTAAQARPSFSGPAHGTAAHENAEKTVTTSAAAKAQAAAVKSVGGGKAGAVTSDYTGNGYETTVTKSDGSTVEVHLTSGFQVMDGPGGGHAPDGAAG